MPYRNVPIKKDVDGKPIPQYFNEVQGEYEAVAGVDGLQKVILCDSNGEPIDVNSINNYFNDTIVLLNELAEVMNNGT